MLEILRDSFGPMPTVRTVVARLKLLGLLVTLCVGLGIALIASAQLDLAFQRSPALADDVRLILKCLVIVLLLVWMLIRFARICLCDNCKDPNAIYVRGDLQLCRDCSKIYDRYMRPRYRRILSFFRSERRNAA